MKHDGFACTRCGMCCRNISTVSELSAFDNGSGVCIHLENNLCTIYMDRPIICRVDQMYYSKYCESYDLETYYRLNYEACRALRCKTGIEK